MTREATGIRIAQLAAITSLVVGAVLLVRYRQWPANFELNWYDVMVQLRIAGEWDDQPVVVFALQDSGDIKPPIEDGQLASILKKLCDAKPRAIGIDLLRDKAVGTGFEQLSDVFESCPVIIGVSLFGRYQNQYVAPPEVLRAHSRYGFADIMVDPDGVVRRGFLALDRGRSGGQEQAEFSLAVRLARLYLADQKPPIKLTSTPLGPDPLSGVRVGRMHVPRLLSYDGGYVAEPNGGYQFLIDYREPLKAIEVVGLGTVLSDSFKPGDVRGRIVLIGNMTAEAKDHFVTPVGRGSSDEDRTPGVFLHAFMAQQLIRYGLGMVRPMRFLPEWLEICFVVLCSVGGTITGWMTRRRFLGVLSVAAVMVILAMSYAGFLAGWWVPPISCALAFPVSALVGNLRGRVRARVFLSYAHEDEALVRKVQLRLQRNGFEVWMDKTDIQPGERWEGVIRQAVHDADCFVLCVTRCSVSKDGFFERELKEALEIWKSNLDTDYRIVPALLENVQLPKELNQFQGVDLTTDKNWGRFTRALCLRNGHMRH